MNKDMNNILKQTIAGMRQQPLISALTVIGTALAICLIMIVMMTREVQIADYGAEPYRSRTLYVPQSITRQEGHKIYNGAVEMKAINEIFMKMKTPELVVAYTMNTSRRQVSAAGSEVIQLRVKGTGNGFFRMFPMSFIEGKPFTKEECDSYMPIALLSRSACRRLFSQETGVKGKSLIIDNYEYHVAGVVEDVSRMLNNASSDIWVPISTHPDNIALQSKLLFDYGNVALLTKSTADFPKIRQETNRLLAAYNKTIAPDTLDFMGGPYEVEAAVNHYMLESDPDLTDLYLHYMLIFAILLIVPAINIASMTQSRLRQREAEIGIRRAFGAKRSTILLQTFMESLIQTLIAGVLGLLLCLGFCFLLANYIFLTDDWTERHTDISIDMDILFSPEIYGWALLFCLVLNVLCATIPAWRASRRNIVETLK